MAGPDVLRVPYRHLGRDALDFQLSPSRSAKDAAGVLARHEAESAALDAAPGLRVTRDLAYGTRPRQRLDLVTPDGPGPFPCLVFIHGGFWQEGSRAGSGFAARALARAGWASALIGYSLTPEVRLTGIVGEIATALGFVRAEARARGIDPARIVLAGHSAGGHLAAAMLAGMGGDAAARGLAGAILISGVYDLAPIAASYVNDLAGIDGREIAALSPLYARPAVDAPVLILVGADEPDAFQAQSDALHAAWGPCLGHLAMARAQGRDHFDVLDELGDPDSAVFDFLTGMAKGR